MAAIIAFVSHLGCIDRAIAFSLRSSSVLASSSIQKWRQVYKSHRNAEAFAAHYHDSHLTYQVLMTWRSRRRENLKQLKVAKKAEKFITLRNTWRAWQDKLAARHRERKVKEFETRLLGRYLRGKWFTMLEMAAKFMSYFRRMDSTLSCDAGEEAYRRSYTASRQFGEQTVSEYSFCYKPHSSAQHIMTNALTLWTTRVADLKFRELEVAQQNDREVLS